MTIPEQSDRALLELAAKAAGIAVGGHIDHYFWERRSDVEWGLYKRNANGTQLCWNPLTDDGDALRLAVKIGMDLMTKPGQLLDGTLVVSVIFPTKDDWDTISEPVGPDICAATRRAIVRAAASMEVDK